MSDPIPTPPSTTLSTPSPTELHDQDPIAAEDEKAKLAMSGKLKPIYLIVATTPVRTSTGTRLGIGLKGKLPWPSIKADMNYFKLVTRDGSSSGTLHGLAPENVDGVNNVVMMGRKTWASIPASFRPLSHRVNVVVTRSKAWDVAKGIVADLTKQKQTVTSMDEAKRAELARKALDDPSGAAAQRIQVAKSDGFEIVSGETDRSVAVRSEPAGNVPEIVVESDLVAAAQRYASDEQRGDVFCIGGAEIYAAFLKSEKLRFRLRILQTEIVRTDGAEFECDTFWPEEFGTQWVEAETRDVESWMRIATPQGTLKEWDIDEKVGVQVRVRGWEATES